MTSESRHAVCSGLGVKLAELIRTALADVSSQRFRAEMINQLQLARLMDRDHKWATPELEAASAQLLPSEAELTRARVADFVDSLGALIDQNLYLRDALTAVAAHPASASLAAIVQAEGERVFVQVIAYGMVLDRLTEAMARDWRLLRSVTRQWDAARKRDRVGRQLVQEGQPFMLAKLVSVLGPIRSIIDFHEQDRVDPDFLRPMLSVNIDEAVVVDMAKGCLANAKAGLVLAEKGPGYQGCGAAFTDSREISVSMPAPERWADLYQAWNMAFVSHYPRFPFVMMKLAIPAVADYRDAPKTYIVRRAIALHGHMHFLLLGRTQPSFPAADMDWRNLELTRAFGRANSASARAYEAHVASQPDHEGRRTLRDRVRRQAHQGARWFTRLGRES